MTRGYDNSGFAAWAEMKATTEMFEEGKEWWEEGALLESEEEEVGGEGEEDEVW